LLFNNLFFHQCYYNYNSLKSLLFTVLYLLEPWVYALAGVLTFIVLLLGIVFFVVHHRRKLFEQALMSQTWRVKYSDIQFDRKINNNRIPVTHTAGGKAVSVFVFVLLMRMREVSRYFNVIVS